MLNRLLAWASAHQHAADIIDHLDAVLGHPLGARLQSYNTREQLRMNIRAIGGEYRDSDDSDLLRWRLWRLARAGNDKPGMDRATARLATWFAIDEGMASRILVAVNDDEERAVKVLMYADFYNLGIAEAIEDVDQWLISAGAHMLLAAWRVVARRPPDERLYWAKKLARMR